MPIIPDLRRGEGRETKYHIRVVCVRMQRNVRCTWLAHGCSGLCIDTCVLSHHPLSLRCPSLALQFRRYVVILIKQRSLK